MMRRQFRRSLSSPETIRAMSSSSLLSIQSNHEDYDGVRIMDVSSSQQQQQQQCEEEEEQAATLARMRRYQYDVDVVQGAIDEGYDGVRIVDVSSSQQSCEEEEENEAEHAVRRRYHDGGDVVVQGANAPNIIIEEEEEKNDDVNDPILIDDDYGFFPVDMDDGDDNDDADDGSNLMMGVPNQPSHEQSNTNNHNNNHNKNTNTNITRTKKQRRSSSLKKGSSYGDLEALIPLNFDRKEYNRILPIPTKLLSKAIPSSSSFTKSTTHKRRSSAATQDNPKGGVFHHASSEPVFVRPVYMDDNDDDDENEEEINLQQEQPVGSGEGTITSNSSSSGRKIPKRTISFGTIQIREHNVTLGDNPSVSRGLPIALDWSSQDFEAMQVDQYEDDYRTPEQIRSKRELLLTPYQRQLLLHGTVGYTPHALATTHQHITKIRQQRLHTKRVATQYPWLHELEDWLESGTRKFKRIVSFSSFK